MPSIDNQIGELLAKLGLQFDALVEQIEQQGRISAAALNPAPPDLNIEQIHQSMLPSANALANHQQMKELHSAMLKVHRKVHQRHQLALHHCRLLQARIRSGGYSQTELKEIIYEIQNLLDRLKRENEIMINDRRRIKVEHDSFVASLGRQITD